MTPDEQSLMEAIVDCVPTWYVADTGPTRHTIFLDADSFVFYGFSPQGPLHDLLRAINADVGDWARTMPSPPTRRYLAAVREKVALHWLRLHQPEIAWNRLLSHMDVLAYRTDENSAGDAEPDRARGSGGVGSPLTMPISNRCSTRWRALPRRTSPSTTAGRYLGYDEVLYGAIEDSEHYDLHPEFLQPLQSQLGPADYSLHLTERGDVIVLGARGMLAAHRRGNWYVYDAQRLQSDMYSSLGDYRLSAHLFSVVLDLSYRGRGALLGLRSPSGRARARDQRRRRGHRRARTLGVTWRGGCSRRPLRRSA